MWTIPNILTLARMGFLPVIVILIWPGIETRETCFWAAVVYAIAGIFDMVDGAIARYTNSVTVFGKFLDPLADKVFYLVTLIALLQLPGPRVPFWLVMVILIRELAITGLRGIAASEGIVIAAGKGGKFKATLATFGIVALLIHYPYPISFGFISFNADIHRVGLWLTYLSVGFALTSAVEYIYGFSQAIAHKPRT